MADLYRNLTMSEVEKLILNGCVAENWEQVKVIKGEGFTADNIRGVVFGGEIRIGKNDYTFKNFDGVVRKAGIYNAEIINCTIANRVFISNISSYIANYDIEDDCYIESVTRIACKGNSSFGNGVEAATVNESGGRKVPIYNNLTAQTAYIMAMYRHRSKLIAKMEQMIGEYTNSVRSDRGRIENNARITSCNTLQDINVGAYAVINCATMLTNGTINSTEETPTYIGAGVKADDFICSMGAVVDNGASLNRCFIGQACTIDYGYMVTDSLFFSNSYCANGEACSIFAGPYTVSHHKSSLLIAGYFLFFNAGSGSNQSNHMFKTGAVHQGIHERGCKFASGAYIMLPAREGAFTVVLGRHKNHHNTEHFPYSYLMEEDGESLLLPGFNLRSFGTLRDINKWKERDKRGATKRDLINFDEYNPYIGYKMLRAMDLSKKMLDKKRVDKHTYNGVKITSVMLNNGLKLYLTAMKALLGTILSEGYRNTVEPDPNWLDIAGMFAPKNTMDQLMDKIESENITTLQQIDQEFAEIYNNYQDHSYAWAKMALETLLLEREATEEDIRDVIEHGRQARESLNRVREDDASKDDNDDAKIGYGIDALTDQAKEMDFANVRKRKGKH